MKDLIGPEAGTEFNICDNEGKFRIV